MIAESTSIAPQSVITCRTSQGTELTANLLRVMRYSVVFELYNPYSIMQLSEVLSDFRIMSSRRLLFHGKAVVSNLLNTGLVLVCEAMLDDGWVEVDFLSAASGKEDLTTQFGAFMEDWRTANKVKDPFKLVVADMANMFSGLQHWMTSVDVGIRTTVTRSREDLEKEIFASVQTRAVEEVMPSWERLESVTKEVDEKDVALHKAYLRRELHPLVLCSPFIYRTYVKPLGYAGDYEMVNMMLRNPYEGSSAFAKLLNFALLHTEPVVAHRNRIDYLVETLRRETRKRAPHGKTRVFNLACGPAVEVGRFVRNHGESDLAEFDLLDFNLETLEYTRESLGNVTMSAGRQTRMRFIQRSVNQILRTAAQGDIDGDMTDYDIVYCAGLFDYLSQRVCQRLVDLFCRMAKPGGLVIVTNVAATNPRKACMEYLMEWNLIHRSVEEMHDLIPHQIPLRRAEVKADATGVNLFLEIELADG